MKKVLLSAVVVLSAALFFSFQKLGGSQPADGYLFLQVSTIESVVPGGLGRSRMITIDENGTMQEVKLENFFSMVGINFGNVRHNDQMITDKIGHLSAQGWELYTVSTGVYPGGPGTEATGIFITRYLFRKGKG